MAEAQLESPAETWAKAVRHVRRLDVGHVALLALAELPLDVAELVERVEQLDVEEAVDVPALSLVR